MMLYHLLTILQDEYYRQHNAYPDQNWRHWVFDPWVREFLRTYTPPTQLTARKET